VTLLKTDGGTGALARPAERSSAAAFLLLFAYNPTMFSERTEWKLAPNRFTQALDQARASGSKILDLTISNPTRVELHYDSRSILAALSSPQALDYDPQPKGLPLAREAVAEYYRSDHGADLDPERVVLTTSTSEGYSFVFRLVANPGDELLVPKPGYPLFEFLADLQDVKLVPYPLIYDHGWQIDLASFERALTPRTRALVVVHPNNPTGSYVKPSEAEALNAFCREHRLAIVADEVFLDYRLNADNTDKNHVGTAAPDCPALSFATKSDVLTFTLSGLSKISALPQMKVAWIVTSGPPEQVPASLARLEIIADTYLSMNAPMQWALPAFLEQRKHVQAQLVRRARANLALLDCQLAAQKICQRLDLEGGWYAILRVPAIQSDEELAIALLRQKSVLVHPGHFYDFPSDGYLVLSLITPEAEFAEGTDRILKHLNS
jgi:alanine-synthesizing transaminase